MKDLFDMTRHARRGMVAMLVAVAVVLLATVVVKSHRTTVPPGIARQDASLLDSKTDTLTDNAVSSVTKKPAKQRPRQRTQRRPAKPEPDHSPHPLEPVPNF